MVSSGATAASASISNLPSPSSLQYIDLINDGTGYLTTPTIRIEKAPVGGTDASAVAIMTYRPPRNGSSIDKILLINPGAGYTVPPKVEILSDTGTGGIATAVISNGSLGQISVLTNGSGYSSAPTVSISSAPSGGTNATALAFINSSGIVTAIRYTNTGAGYTSLPSITLSSPVGTSTGNFIFNESIRGVSTGTTAYVKDWDADTKVLKVSIANGNFALGELIVGSNATHKVFSIQSDDLYDPYAQNTEIENESDSMLDFSQRNPFGDY
jgi:hypothetical protein